MLETEQWKKAKEIFQTAMDLPLAERQKFIDNESNGDELIKAEVETLLEAHDEAGNFIAAPAVAVTDFFESEQKTSIVGKQIGAYKILEEIGRGGMGAVYLVERADEEFTKKVAVKLIKRGLDTDEIINRFRNERQILANLEHPNIARLLDGGATEDGLPFLVMEYVEVLQIAADSIEKDFAASPEIVADLSTTIGLTFLSIGQIDSAEPHLTKALEIRKSLFGLENHETAMSLHNFGKLLQAKGDLKHAEKLFRQSLTILRRVRGTDILDIASVLGNLGYLLMLEAKYEEAKNAHHEELQILRGRLGENHSEFARTLSNLANIFSVTGDKQTAESMHRKAFAVTQKFYGGEHPDVALAMLHLAITINSTKPDEAESLFRQCLTLRRRFFGDGHTETAWSLYYLGDILLRKENYEQAAECALEVLTWRGRSIPETHSVINSTLLMLARCYLAENRPAEAETLLRECVALRRETLPSEHWLIATAEGYLAECFLQLRRFDEAAPLLRESYETLLAKLGENHEHTKQARKRLEEFEKISRKI